MSEARAKAVKNYLEAEVPTLRNHIETIGNGDTCAKQHPDISKDDARRVDFFSVAEDETFPTDKICDDSIWKKN